MFVWDHVGHITSAKRLTYKNTVSPVLRRSVHLFFAYCLCVSVIYQFGFKPDSDFREASVLGFRNTISTDSSFNNAYFMRYNYLRK